MLPIFLFEENQSLGKDGTEAKVIWRSFCEVNQFIGRYQFFDHFGVDDNNVETIEDVRDKDVVFEVLCFLIVERVLFLLWSRQPLLIVWRAEQTERKFMHFVPFAFEEFHVVLPFFERFDVESIAEVSYDKDRK